MRKFKIVKFGVIKPEGTLLSFDGFKFAGLGTEESADNMTNVEMLQCIIDSIEKVKKHIIDEGKEAPLIPTITPVEKPIVH